MEIFVRTRQAPINVPVTSYDDGNFRPKPTVNSAYGGPGTNASDLPVELASWLRTRNYDRSPRARSETRRVAFDGRTYSYGGPGTNASDLSVELASWLRTRNYDRSPRARSETRRVASDEDSTKERLCTRNGRPGPSDEELRPFSARGRSTRGPTGRTG